MRAGLLTLLAIGCTPGEPGDAYVLADDHAARIDIRVDGEAVDASLPLAVEAGAVVETAGDRVEVGPDEVAHVQGASGRIELFVLGVDIEPELIAVAGPDDVVIELADALGVDLEETAEGWLLGDADLWPLLADADLPEEPLTLRPVSADDLPGTAPLGDPGPAPAIRRSGGLWQIFDGPAPETDAGREQALARRRAVALFDLDDGDAVLPSTAGLAAARLVGRYCAEGQYVTLGASGQATACDDGGCTELPWSLGAGSLTLGDAAWSVEETDGGYVLYDRAALTDLTIGGCP